MHTSKKIPKSPTQNKTLLENQRDDFTSRSSSASLVSSSQMSSQIWHSLDMKEKVIGNSNTSGIRNTTGGGTSGISSLNASSESFNPPITQAIIPPDHQSTRNVVSTLPTEQQQRDSSIQIKTETVINSTKAITTSVVQSKSVTKKKELLEMSPRDYSPPEPNYVCFGCNVVGEHWRAFCPVRPLKGSLPPKARMLMLAAGAPQPSLNQPLPTRDTNGQERFPPSPSPPPPPPFSSFRTQSASGLPTPFSMQSQDSVLNNINLGLNLSSDAPSIPAASTNRDRDDPLLIDLGLGYIANDSTKTVKVNELLPTVATVPQAQTLSPSLSASSSFFQNKEQVSQQQSSVSSTPTASMSLPASGMWSDTSASSSLFSANSISISSSSSPEQHRTDNNSSSANRSLIPSLPIPTSLSNSVQSLSDKLNWISNGVRFIV